MGCGFAVAVTVVICRRNSEASVRWKGCNDLVGDVGSEVGERRARFCRVDETSDRSSGGCNSDDEMTGAIAIPDENGLPLEIWAKFEAAGCKPDAQRMRLPADVVGRGWTMKWRQQWRSEMMDNE